MKVFTNIMKVLTALATVAGIVYVIATYGDKIVAWAKKLLRCGKRGCCRMEDFEDEAFADEAVEEEAPVEEAAAEEIPADENVVQADEADFEG